MINKIKDRIKLLGLQKKHVAERVGITPVQLSHYLKEQRKMPIEVETRLINYLKI